MLALPWLAGLLGIPSGVGAVQLDGADPVAFVNTTTSSGTPLRWANSCVFVRPSSDGVTDLTPEQLAGALAIAKDAWPNATRDCGYLQIILEEPDHGEVGLDYVNRIVFREQSWCRPGPPQKCYDAGAAAITTLFFIDTPGHPDDGIIIDADIELNAVNYAFATCVAAGTCTTAGSGVVEDLANTLVHELGHLVGLDHTCWSGFGTQPVDDKGQPVPACAPASSLPPDILDATMYPFQDPMELKKQTPEVDDIAGFCAKYPKASDPGACVRVPEPPGDHDADAGGGQPFDSGPCGCRANDSGSMLLGLLVVLSVTGGRRYSVRRRGARARSPG